ncbi:hypothetical protein SCUCBS95973_002469 [Sporothrix curviconia]|uniref:Zn(2)-C6 fungal-type domain-containing protein n=1 Tax=Sporothrix curviconia TaxID=1260050 RepID=A0ABP0B800_9PEZI
MILGRASKPRSRASIACAGCRARRTKCIIGEGQSACDRCIRLSKTCVLRDDDERKRPVTKAQVHALVRRIGALEQHLSNAGLEIPPMLAEDLAAAANVSQSDAAPTDQTHDDGLRRRRTSMREDVAAAVQGSVVSAAALVAAATGHGRNAAQAATLRGESSASPPQHQLQQHQQQHHNYPSGASTSSAWTAPPPLPPGQSRHSASNGRNGSISGASGTGGMMMMDETDSPASTAASSDIASSAMYSESEQRRRLRSGSMSLGGPGGHSRYIGITTNYHIYSNMYHAEKEETRREREKNAARTREVLAKIPYEAHSHLINQFWSCYNTIIHIVHRKAFELDSGMLVSRDGSSTPGGGIDNRGANLVGNNQASGNGSYYSPFLHVCMLAIGYRYANRSRADVQAFATPDGESLLHEEAKRLVDHELQMPGGIPSLQSLLLLGDLECGVGRYNTGWLYAGMACRLIFDLGLNRQISQAGQSRLDMEVKRTVLWGCVLLDRFWGLFLGRPTSIKISDISISSTNTTQPRRMQGCLPMGPQCRFETEIYEALISLTDTASKLTDAAHRHYTTSDPSAYYFVTGLHRELRSWYKQLPGRLQWTPANLARNPPSAFFNLHQQYHTMFILMYRPFLSAGKATPAGTHNTGGGQTNGNPEPAPYRARGSPYDDVLDDSADGMAENSINMDNEEDDDNDDDVDPELGTDIVTEMARKMCFAHAIEVARIYEAFCARFECRSMFVTGMQHAATAAFAIVEGLATQSADKQAETLLHLQRLAEALYAHASVYYPARVMSNILFRVLGEYRDSHAQRQQQQQQQQQHNTQAVPHASQGHNSHHMHLQSIDMSDAGAAPQQPSTIAPAWATSSTSPGMMQPPPVPGQTAHTTPSGSVVPVSVPVPGPDTMTPSSNTDWAGMMHGDSGGPPGTRGTAHAGAGHSSATDLHSTMLDGSGANGFVDFEFDSGIWESIMNTLSQPLDSVA